MRKRFVFIKVSDKFQFVEQTKGAHMGISRMCALRDGTGRTPECLGASLHSEQGAAPPLHRESGYPLKAKGVTTKSNAFCLFYCLTNTPLTVGAVFFLPAAETALCRFESGCQSDELSAAPLHHKGDFSSLDEEFD